ncbi:hypothetical protein OROMI_015797 [Orobanche minor]
MKDGTGRRPACGRRLMYQHIHGAGVDHSVHCGLYLRTNHS